MTRPRAARFGALALVVLLAAACAGSGAPETLDEQKGPLDDEYAAALPAGLDTENMPLFERNFYEGCLGGGEGELDPNLAQVEQEGLGKVCVCIYNGFAVHFEDRATVEAEAEAEAEATADDIARQTYSLFADANDRLADGDSLGEIDDGALVAISAECITTEAGAIE